MPPKRAKRKQPSNPKSKPTRKNPSRSTAPSSSRQQQKLQPHQPSDREIGAAFRTYAVSRDDISNPSDLSDDEDDETLLRIADVRRCLRALDLPAPPPDFFDAEQRFVGLSEFVALAKTLAETANIHDDDDEGSAYGDGDEVMGEDGNEDEDAEQAREIDDAFALFLGGSAARPSGSAGARITIADLRRVARSLKEDVDDKTLALMIQEANGEQGKASVGRGVGRSEFESVMKRARVFT